MAIQLSDLGRRAVMDYTAASQRRSIRREDKKICLAHPDWEPLTAQELAAIDPKDRYGYTIYKNMTGETENLRYFIPDAPYRTRILPMLNPENHLFARIVDVSFSDKNYHGLYMPEVRFPRTVLHCVRNEFFDEGFGHITSAQALDILSAYDKLVFKQTTDTRHGEGVRLVERKDFGEKLTAFASDYLVQELVVQHESLSYFSPTSVNVIRINSLCWKGRVYALGGILRVGAPGAFCDHESRNGKSYLTIPIAEDGTIVPRAYDIDNYRVYDNAHGVKIRGVIPRFREMKELTIREHIRYPRYALIGWDFTVDRDGNIICMEFNTKYPGMNGTQSALGPVFAQKTPEGNTLFDELFAAVK